ncbi:hypothetical protein M1293_02765 [Candidatus Parvarchaeota archaeon]|nr:hypothetical protein [Candidatus Parvarchaeota archaeon]
MDQMEENNEIKKIEEKEKKVEHELSEEEKRLSKEIEYLEKTRVEVKKLEAESKKAEGKERITDIEIQLNTDSLKKVTRVLYDIMIKKRVLFYLLLVLAVLIGVMIRTSSLPALGASPLIGNNYLNAGGSLTGLDPYIFYIEMNNILSTGNVPAVEHLEYLPLGLPTRADELMISFFGAYSARLLDPVIKGATPMTWFMLYPPFVTIFSTLLLFFICLALFGDYWVASLSAFVFPAFLTFLSRSTAGFSTKTAMGYMFILLSIYFLVKALKSEKTKSKLIYGVMLGISTGLASAASGYDQYLIITVPVTYLLLILFDYARKGDLYAYLAFGLWVPINASFVSLSADKLISDPLFYPMYVVYITVLFKALVYDKYSKKLKIPLINHGLSSALYGILISVAAIAILGLHELGRVASKLISEVSSPLGVGVANPVTQTIAEYAKITLSQRVSDYNFLVGISGGSIGLNFLLLSLGAIFILYFVLRRFKHWYVPFLLSLPFILVMNGGSYTPGPESASVFSVFVLASFIPIAFMILKEHKKITKMNNTVILVAALTLVSIILSFALFNYNQTSNYYKYGAFGLAIILIGTIAFDKRDDGAASYSVYLPVLAFFILATVLSNVESRLLEPTELAAAILIPFAVVLSFKNVYYYLEKWLSGSKRTKILIAAVVVVIAFAFVVLDIYTSLSLSYVSAQQSGSGLALWGPSLLWVNQNTPTNSSIISWWDYGYWEEAIANRTTVADGSNAYGYQSMIAKYFFEATSPYEYATYLHYIHEPTYAVISGSEVLKFSAISTIALNYTQFTPFPQVPNAIKNSQNIGASGYEYLEEFGGNGANVGPLEANIKINGTEWNGSDTLVVAILVPFNFTNGTFSSGNPYGVLYNGLTQQESTPLPFDGACTYGVGCKNVTSDGIPGAVLALDPSNTAYLHIGGYKQSPSGYLTAPINLSNYGNQPGVLFMPQKSLDTLFVKLYLLNETVPGFKLVFSDGMPVNSLLSINNQVLPNINIYEINYSQLSPYMLTGECSVSTSAPNYCANLNYLPAVFGNYSSKISSTPIP